MYMVVAVSYILLSRLFFNKVSGRYSGFAENVTSTIVGAPRDQQTKHSGLLLPIILLGELLYAEIFD